MIWAMFDRIRPKMTSATLWSNSLNMMPSFCTNLRHCFIKNRLINTRIASMMFL